MSFETIPVQIQDSAGDRHSAEALLVPDARVQGLYGGDEVRLRLPEGMEGVAVGDRIALRRDPPSDCVFDLLEEKRDVYDRPLWRARFARPPVPSQYRETDASRAAQRQIQRDREAYHASFNRMERRIKERVELIVQGLDDDAAQALLSLLGHNSHLEAHFLQSALEKRLAREPQPAGVERV